MDSRGQPETFGVGADGSSTRYQQSAYDGMRKEWIFIISNWVVPQEFLLSLWRDKSFFIVITILTAVIRKPQERIARI